jgi:p-cumate 2,3-dioxygenase beta subunit
MMQTDIAASSALLTRAQAEDFLYFEASLLDEWKLNEWLELLTPDAAYYIPPNDKPDGDHRTTLFIIADDAERIRQRVIRILDPNCHAEAPRSRIRRHLSNVRVLGQEGDLATVAANFICHRYRRHERVREYVGGLKYLIRLTDAGLRIKERRIVLDAQELGSLGSVSFIL